MASKAKKPNTRIKPEQPGGFRDLATAEMIAKNELIEKVKTTFELFGFDPMDTPAVERTEILTGGEKESQKIIYNVRPALASKDGVNGSREKKSQTSLRFDLTVPLARFLAANPAIPKPFKRYQISKVWRGESPQAGRYREFTQADIDIVGTNSMEADAEIVAVIYQVMKNLGIEDFIIKINNRKILNDLPQFAEFPERGLDKMLRLIDKQDKIGPTEVKKEIAKTFSKKVATKVDEFFADLRNGNGQGEGQKELAEIQESLTAMGVDLKKIKIDYNVVRGLGYYTGPVFETVMTKTPELGSVFSGGRYDNLLIPFTGEKIPAVGASLGVDRLMAMLKNLGQAYPKSTILQVLVFNLEASLKKECWMLSEKLRSYGINTSLYLGDDRTFQAQLSYAVKKQIPYILIYGAQEKKKGMVTIKDLTTREQVEIPKGNIEKTVEFVEK